MKVKIRGMNEAVQVEDYQGEALIGVINDRTVPRDELLKIGDLNIKKSEIVAVLPSDVGVIKGSFNYDINNQSHRELIKDFEKEFNEFVKNNPDKYFKNKDERKVGYKEHWMQELGIIKINGDNLGDYVVKDMDRCVDFKKKWTAFQELRIRRVEAKEKDYQQHANEVIASMKQDETPLDEIPF